MSITYRVFIVIQSPFRGGISDPASPIETIFTSALPGSPGILKFGNTVTRFELPSTSQLIDSKIPVLSASEVLKAEKSSELVTSENVTKTHQLRAFTPDYEIFRKLVTEWDINPAQGVVMIKTSSVTCLPNSDKLAEVINLAETELSTFDLFYFARWLDRPDQYVSLSELQGGAKLIQTMNPNSFQAIAISPGGMAKLKEFYPPDTNPVVCRAFSQILNQLIQKGNLVAASSTPCLVAYDALRIAQRAETGSPEAPFSYLKLAEARGDTSPERPFNRRLSAECTPFWLLIIVIVAGIVGAFLIYFGGLVGVAAL